MKSTAKIFYGITLFLTLMTVFYIVATHYVHDTGSFVGTEWVGVVGMILATAMNFMLGAYLHFTERRIDVLPEDWEEARIEDAAGTVGFFSPGSIWPITMVGGIAVLGYGIAFMSYWMLILGAVILVWAAVMLNLQYGLPKEKH